MSSPQDGPFEPRRDSVSRRDWRIGHIGRSIRGPAPSHGGGRHSDASPRRRTYTARWQRRLSDACEQSARSNLTISENAGTGERLDMLCGHFVLSPAHDRLLRDYLPPRLIVSAADRSASTAGPGTAAQLAGLVGLMRNESAIENLGGRAMLNALSTAKFALTLRLASELKEAPAGLLALAGYPRLAPALEVLFHEPDRAWSLPELARLCNMSRATMARHFQEKLGRTANDLLTDIRMTLAANNAMRIFMAYLQT